MSDKKKIGKEFERAFTEGMENNDWSYLNDVIIKSVDNFLDGVGDRMNSAMEGATAAVPLSKRKEDFSGNTETAKAQRKLHEERARVRAQMERERKERERARKARSAARSAVKTTELAFPYRNVGAGVSTVKSIVGGIGVGVTSIMALTGLVTSGIASFSFVAPLIFAGVFGYVLSGGIRTDRLSRLADRYVQIIGKRQYIEVKALSFSTGKSEKQVVRELRKLLKLGYFPQGHLDINCKTFILTDEVFNHYLELEMSGTKDGVIDTTGRYEDEQQFPTLSAEDSATLSRMIREGNDYISRFHTLNNDIPGIEISAKLDRFEGLLREIFERVKEHPEQMSRIGELMDYYLPTAAKLVEAYREYDSVSEPGKEIVSAKRDIENTIDTINSAMSKLLNKLFKDSVLDVTTDAQVLKTVLAQKGLSEGDVYPNK
jgi:5-bromo-4-chloroindolyl phosphate hydrolysis protein